MQSFRERCGFHGNQNYQPTSQDSSRLENYRHQSQSALNCERHRQVTKSFYAQTSCQGYENSAGEKYLRGDKNMNVQQLQGRVSFASFSEGNVYPGQFTGEDGLQNWGQSQMLSGAKYEENVIKKTSGEGRGYQESAGQNPFRSHSMHPSQQQALSYAKIPRQKVQTSVASSPLSFSQTSHFNQTFPTSTYSSVPGGSQVSHSYKSCTAPSNPQHDRMAAPNAGQRVQAMHGYQATRMSSYEQPQRHHSQETLHYQNMTKYQHYSQQNQTYCQAETPSRTPEQYYQTFSPSASHSPARSVGRSPSYSSTPSPLMPNLENYQYNQQQHNTGNFPLSMSDHSHFMPLLNISPTGTSSPESQSKTMSNDKIPETLLSDLSLQSLTALTSQVENISNTVQQLLLSKSGMAPKKAIKASPRTPEQLKGQHCSPESSTYSAEQLGTPLSDALGTPQSVHAEIQEADYLSGSEDQLERNYLYCGPGQSPARANNIKMKPESISTCSVTSPDNMSTKSDDSFQSIHASLPLETFAKLVSGDRECPHLLVSALSQEELSTEIIALQDAIDNEKAEKAWIDSPVLNNESSKSPLNLENNCVDSVVMQTWPSQENLEEFPDVLKKSLPEEAKLRDNRTCYNVKPYKKEDYLPAAGEVAETTETTVNLSAENNIEAATSSPGYTSSSNTTASTTCTKTSDPFGWTEKNMAESCLRWKELEMKELFPSLHASDLDKGLFQVKDNKIDGQLDVPDVETTLENDSGEGFNKEGAEDLAYTEDGKVNNEKWLEDTRDCYTEDDFQDIPDIPSQKDSNLEPEDYSSLCDFSERKSFLYDASLSKPLKDMETLSSINTPESLENPSIEEKENSAPSQLSGNSIVLLGPAVATESKVKSWFESTLTHIKTVGDIKAKNEEEAVDCTPEPLTLPDGEKKDPKVQEKQLDLKTEEPIERKPLRSKRIQCRALDASESEKVFQDLVNETAEMPNEKILVKETNSVPANKTPVVERKPARMCTRSSIAKAEPRVHGPDSGMPDPHQEKNTKQGELGVKETASCKTGKKSGKGAMKLISSGDKKNFVLQKKSSGNITGQKVKDKSVGLLKDEKSMILRSRNNKPDLFQSKRRKGKRGINMVLKKPASLKKIIGNCAVPEPFKLVPRVRKQLKVSNPVLLNAKVSPERSLHSLKRKPSFISPVPPKKKNLVMRRKHVKEEKSEPPSNLFKKMRQMKKEKVKLTVAPKKTCKAIVKSPAVRMNPEVCIKVSSRSVYSGAVKTKVLPPRKGRGLKLEAIVQKITSPNQKKHGGAFTCLQNVVTAGTNAVNMLAQGKELKEIRVVSADCETGTVSQNNALTKSEPDLHTVNCRSSNNRSLKGKALHGKKLTSASLHCTSTHAGTEQEGNRVAAKRLSTVPKKRIRRGRSKGALSSAKNPPKKLSGTSPSVLASRDKAPSEGVLHAKKHRTTELKGSSSIPNETKDSSSQVRARKRTKYASFNGYAKRQRKCSPRNKPIKQTTGSRRRARRQSTPLISPKEPEIKLKYVSTKPVRPESRVRPFSPYIQVEKRNEFTTTCTIINTAGEESRFHKERSAPHTSLFTSSGSLPFSSQMQLGPLVSKTVPSGCLVCCLCRSPANFKDLGDLCGPYYPVDCLPNKKSRPKDKVKTEEPCAAEKIPKASESVCTAGSGKTPCLDNGEVDTTKHNNLRSSARGLLRKMPSCYCCSKKVEIAEIEKPRKHQCSKVPDPPPPELETQEHWVHEACAVWTSGVYLVAGKLYGIHEAIQMAATGVCPKCQRPGATVGCSHKGCEQSYHFTCAMEAGKSAR
ncbi:hypothetical protein GDO86_017583 [Hymenochirus boettgeri]|uniref:PHD-type domain-containing protein n=1 Tax=Hymenochirus boettgeri TaxID=247094 RepID=A0A8T2IT57_9PIPI|nr:hypothetical protein GDO86_017583 [Hymenochirus boettgeri]